MTKQSLERVHLDPAVYLVPSTNHYVFCIIPRLCPAFQAIVFKEAVWKENCFSLRSQSPLICPRCIKWLAWDNALEFWQYALIDAVSAAGVNVGEAEDENTWPSITTTTQSPLWPRDEASVSPSSARHRETWPVNALNMRFYLSLHSLPLSGYTWLLWLSDVRHFWCTHNNLKWVKTQHVSRFSLPPGAVRLLLVAVLHSAALLKILEYTLWGTKA